MLEKILPLVKYIFFNFDYFLILVLFFIWLFIKKKPNSYISQRIIKMGDFLYSRFIKLTEVNAFKLLLIFFVLNFVIRLLMILPVPEISAMENIIAPHYVNLAKSLYQGGGFTTHVIWNNFLEHSQIIRPDFFRLPFYPSLIFLFYKIFGLSFFSAKLVNVFAGSLLPIFSYLLAYALTKSKKIATLLLIFISFNGLILTWVAITYPEIIYCCCGILLLYFLYKTKNKINFYIVLVGVFWALAYLTRGEALYIFLPVILFYYFYKQNKKQFLIKTALTILCFLIAASPYLIRNYTLTKNPFYSDFDKIVMVAYYVDQDRLIESPEIEYKNIYDLALKNPLQTIKYMVEKIIVGLISIPGLLICGYLISLLSLIGIFYLWRKNRSKYYFIFLAMLLGFLVPVLAIHFSDRYLIFLIILFYLFAGMGFFKLYDINLKNNHLLRSFLTIYLVIFIIFNGLVGIGKGTVPYIPHSFYKRFDAQRYFTDLQIFYDYIKANTEKDDVIMVSRRPYGVHYFTERPIILFPYTDIAGVQEFMEKYQVKWLIRMGMSSKIDGKYFKFFLPDEIPENIKPVFNNAGGDLFQVEYYTDE